MQKPKTKHGKSRPLLISLSLIILGGILNVVVALKPESFWYLYIPIYALYMVGLWELVRWLYKLSGFNVENLSIRRIVSKIFTGIARNILIPGIIGIVLAIVVIPKIVSYYQLSTLKKESYGMILQLLRNDESNKVRKVAVMCLGNIGDKNSMRILSDEMVNQPLLIDQIAKFVTKKDDGKKNIDNKSMLLELKKIYSDRSLTERDYKDRMLSLVNGSISSLRKLKKWLEKGNTTDSENRVVESIGLMANIDRNIDNLNQLAQLYSESESSYDFVAIVNNINKELDDFHDLYEHFANNQTLQAALIGRLENLSDRIAVYYEHLRFGNKKEEEEIKKYQNIIKALVTAGLKDAIKEFTNLAKSEEIAHSIRLEAIESLGIIGNHNQLQILLDVTKHTDPEIRQTALAAIGMILSDKRDIKLYEIEEERSSSILEDLLLEF